MQPIRRILDACAAATRFWSGSSPLSCLSFAGFAAAILHAMMRMCAPGEDALTMVVEARQNVALIWCAGIGLGGWGLASLGGGPVAEAVARAGGLPALFITLGVALAVLRYCFTPHSDHRRSTAGTDADRPRFRRRCHAGAAAAGDDG